MPYQNIDATLSAADIQAIRDAGRRISARTRSGSDGIKCEVAY